MFDQFGTKDSQSDRVNVYTFCSPVFADQGTLGPVTVVKFKNHCDGEFPWTAPGRGHRCTPHAWQSSLKRGK
jgi:hypothetical protein